MVSYVTQKQNGFLCNKNTKCFPMYQKKKMVSYVTKQQNGILFNRKTKCSRRPFHFQIILLISKCNKRKTKMVSYVTKTQNGLQCNTKTKWSPM